MNETLKRGLSGAVYVAIMWLGTSYSELSFHILFSVILVICLYEMWKLRKGKTKILAFIYVLTPLLLVHLYSQKIILFIFILTWTFDTFAYLFGVKYGKHKIMPSISPKKSWEGFAGGLLLTLIVTSVLIKIGFLPENGSYLNFYSTAFFIPFTATLGDFIESHFKRQAGVKDSGNFIPGHGGILDRMDAFMITIPALMITVYLVGFIFTIIHYSF
jgi:CDP-diglyceride synthetase